MDDKHYGKFRDCRWVDSICRFYVNCPIPIQFPDMKHCLTMTMPNIYGQTGSTSPLGFYL